MKNVFATGRFVKGRVITLAAAIFALAMCASCNALKTGSRGSVSGDWAIASVNGKEIRLSNGERQPFIHFNGDEGRIHGYTGCNSLMGTCVFDRKSGGVAFGNLGSTMMACPDLETEQEILKAISSAVSFAISAPKKMELKDKEGKTVLALVETGEK